ncbi:hypothetical protein ACNF40_00400 [Cuniculiplasma sp. SKW4]|uniref:hypothetical protein n=1 Tax=Cuniculiplasma sp. SKW4 TaxID=3400171 RepID=UPI003FD1E3B5
MRPKDIKGKGISQRALYKVRVNLKSGKPLNPKVRIVRGLLEIYKELRTDSND